MHLRPLFALALCGLLLAGCAGGVNQSAEYRLRVMEEQYMELQERLREQDARMAAMERGAQPQSLTSSSSAPQPYAAPVSEKKDKSGKTKSSKQDKRHSREAEKSKSAPPAKSAKPQPQTYGPPPAAPAAPVAPVATAPAVSAPPAPAAEVKEYKPTRKGQTPLPVAAAQNASKAAMPAPPPAAGLHSLPPASMPGAPVPAIPLAAQTPSASSAGGSADYDKGLELTRKGDTAGARAMFQSYIANNPGNQLTPNAIFWLGETYYVDKQFDQAILSFKEIAGRYPTHAKAPASMLKLGYAYEQLGDKGNARFYLRALIDEYPQSEPAKLAKEKLGSLGQ